jgi:hypothetical protein
LLSLSDVLFRLVLLRNLNLFHENDSNVTTGFSRGCK